MLLGLPEFFQSEITRSTSLQSAWWPTPSSLSHPDFVVSLRFDNFNAFLAVRSSVTLINLQIQILHLVTRSFQCLDFLRISLFVVMAMSKFNYRFSYDDKIYDFSDLMASYKGPARYATCSNPSMCFIALLGTAEHDLLKSMNLYSMSRFSQWLIFKVLVLSLVDC